MGLDMYAFTMPAAALGTQQVDVTPHIPADDPEVNGSFAYWRKFHQLHGWMRRLYVEKGGKSEEFNCNTVRLMPEDIDRLERELNEKEILPDEEGFFFGNYPDNSFNAERAQEVRDFIAKCREEFEDGRAVVYDSWW